MSNDPSGQSLLDELDARQNELLDELDALNARIEQVIAESLTWRGDAAATPPVRAAA